MAVVPPDTVGYQVYLPSFQDSDGDGWGDLPGLLSRLDYLSDLGVTLLWVSPFYPSPMRDHGYDVADYRGIDPRYGTMSDVDKLLSAAHARGMRVPAPGGASSTPTPSSRSRCPGSWPQLKR